MEQTKNQVAYEILQCIIDDNILSAKIIDFLVKLNCKNPAYG